MRRFPVRDGEFKISSYSDPGGIIKTCVAVAKTVDGVAVRHSQDSGKSTLFFTSAEWEAFLKYGGFFGGPHTYMARAKPKLYILPGWGHRITDKNYQKLIAIAEKKYKFVPLRIATRNRKYALGNAKSLHQIIKNITRQIALPSSDDVIFGFSIGALQAYLVARKLKFNKIILCSISSVLENDLQTYSKSEALKIFSPLQCREMRGVRYYKLKNSILLYGEKESEITQTRSKSLGKIVEIKEGDHVLDNAYINTIKKYL